jgi:pyrrolidone-carboxylate peptidase
MSHVGNGENDLLGMEKMDPKMREYVTNVRILAREIIDDLEPFHLITFGDLEGKLKVALERVGQEKSWNRLLEDVANDAEKD